MKKRFSLLILFIFVFVGTAFAWKSPPYAPQVDADDTAYNATSWDGNPYAATKNAIRDKLEAIGAGRDFSKLDLTADTVITEAQIIANKWISNQGDTGEADLTLPAISYSILVIFLVEETQVIEVNPPSGEAPMLDGVLLDANDCVDSDAVVGSCLSAIRTQNAAGTWYWHFIASVGAWADTGSSD